MSNTSQDQEQLVLENQGLVVNLAKSFCPPNTTEFEEYKQVGNIGLWKASQKYDPSRGNAFSTLAWHCIRNEIIRYIRKRENNKTISMENQALEWVCNSNEIFTDIGQDTSDFFPSNLTDKERNTLVFREQGYTFGEIGDKIGGVSKGGASDIYKQAIKKLKAANPDV